jgi:ligand-binding sensor domain-containing protein
MLYKSFHIKVYVLLLILSCNFSAIGQQFQYEHYGVDEGMPSPETYFAFEDAHGFMWFGTDRGLSCYDGYKFTNYTTANSQLTNNTIFKCYEAPNNDIWFTCYDGSISIYNLDNKTFKPFNYNDSLKVWFKYWPKRVDFINNEAIIYAVNDNFSFVQYNFLRDDIKFTEIGQCRLLADYIDSPNGQISQIYSHKEINPQAIFTNKVSFTGKLKQKARNLIDNSMTLRGSLYFAHDFSLYHYTSGHVTKKKTFNEPIQHMAKTTDSQLMVLTNKFIYKNENGNWRKLDITNNYSYMTIDSEGNTWVCSLNNGIFKFPDLRYAGYFRDRANNIAVSALFAMNNTLVVGLSNETIFTLSKSWEITGEITKFSDIAADLRVTAIHGSPTRAITTGGFELMDSANCEFVINRLPRSLNYKGAVRLQSNKLLYYEYEPGFFVLKDDSTTFYNTNNEQIVTLNDGEDGIVRFGTVNGLWEFNHTGTNQSLTKIIEFPVLKQRINAIANNKNGTVIYGTGTSGVVLQKGNDFFVLTKELGLQSNVINGMHLENDSTLWVATNNGFSKVIIDNNISSSYVDFSLNADDGIQSNYIYSIAHWDNSVWLGTDKGLMKMPGKDLMRSRVSPRMNVLKFQNLNSLDNLETRNLTYKQNNIRIEYVGICFNKPSEDYYRYRLRYNGSQLEQYKYTDETSLDFYNLQPGQYVLEIACKNNNNLWSETELCSFNVIPHFTQTSWFVKTMYFLGTILILLLIYYQVNGLQEKYERENHLQMLEYKFQESELAVLRNQMNPHFVFNALNSIQSYVMDNDMKTASVYIQQFSTLMRQSLDYSKSDYISLSNEIKFLNNYLNIEQLRFPSRFAYNVEVLVNEETNEVMMPPLIIFSQ